MEADEPYYGALIGRVGNQIADGEFSLNGETYTLEQNNGPNSLHGGPKGFHNVVWDAEQIDSKNLKLTYSSEDGVEGFPGTLDVKSLNCKISDYIGQIFLNSISGVKTPFIPL